MRRLLCCLLILMAAIPWALADRADEWAVITAVLSSDEPDPVPESWRISVRENQLSRASGLEEGVMNVLLFSTDAPDMTRNWGRTDSMIVCSIRLDTGDVKLLSLPVHSLVPVEGLPQEIRLRYVNCFGGPLLAVKTVNQALQLNIERYCAVNFDAFVSVVNALGGVELPMTAEERAALDLPGTSGLLDGDQALRYVRLRSGGSGMERYRALLSALLRRAMSRGIEGAFELLDSLLPIIDTNLTTDNLMDLIFALLGPSTLGALEMWTLPITPGETASLTETQAAMCRQWIYGNAPADGD